MCVRVCVVCCLVTPSLRDPYLNTQVVRVFRGIHVARVGRPDSKSVLTSTLCCFAHCVCTREVVYACMSGLSVLISDLYVLSLFMRNS